MLTPPHERIGPFDGLSDKQLQTLIARIYSNNVEDDAFEQSGTSPTKNGEPDAL
jgi:hypothetical protein